MLNQQDALWLLFFDNQLLVKIIENNVTIPSASDLKALAMQLNNTLAVGNLEQVACYAAEIKTAPELPDNFSFQGLWQLLPQLDEAIFALAGRAYSLVHWVRTTKFCGQCGTANQNKLDELARKCPNCGLISYPRISPAVIVAIIKDNQILLARNKNFRTNHYSVISGFVEPGETLEACVKREIKEEVGIEVKNIRYFASQPWSFPDSLMVGFVAAYKSGEIKVDNEEIMEAGWFTPDNLPNLAAKSTIARSLIDWFANEKKICPYNS